VTEPTQHEAMIAHLKSATTALEKHTTAIADGVAKHLTAPDHAATTPTPRQGE
jgi:hypothetical protein